MNLGVAPKNLNPLFPYFPLFCFSMQTPMSVFWAHICVIQTQTVMTPLAHTAVPAGLDQLELAESVMVSLCLKAE